MPPKPRQLSRLGLSKKRLHLAWACIKNLGNKVSSNKMKNSIFKWVNGVIILSSTGLLMGCLNEEKDRLANSIPEKIDFNYHIKPILSDKCFACHGPDAANRKGDLRLDTEDGAYTKLADRQRAAIAPHNLRKSEVYHRIVSEDPAYTMPPPESHLQLSDTEKAMLNAWIEQGAEYKPHWAFIKPSKTNPPQTSSKASNPIDQFILAKLAQEGLSFSPKATKETLIRRASFDITGLPPSLEDIDAFLTNEDDHAFESLIDALLAKPSYGERMAANWMDVARFADSDGYLDDKHRNFTPWRDWVINAFNNNMPYDQFVTWQLAGDLIENPTQESILATAFNRLNKRNSEAGIVFEEYRVEYTADRTNTLGKAFLGLSLECARCHDHKYDPISQKDYYELFGYFNSTFEMGTAVYGPGQTPGPALLLTNEIEQKQLDSLQQYIGQIEEDLSVHLNQEQRFKDWKSRTPLNASLIENQIKKANVAHYAFDEIKNVNGNNSVSPELYQRQDPASLKQAEFRQGVSGNAFFVNDYNHAKLGKKVGWFDRTDPFSIQLWLYPDTLYQETNMFWHCEDLRLGQKGYTLGLRNNELFFAISHSWPQNAIEVQTEKAIPTRKWSQITVTYDGSSRAEGIQLYVDGRRQSLNINLDHLYRGILYEPNIHTYGFHGIMIGARDKYTPFKNGGIDEVSVYNSQLTDLEVLFTFNKELALKEGKEEEFLKPFFHHYHDEIAAAKRQTLKNTRKTENAIVTGIPEIMVMGDLPQPRPTYVLDRGLYDAKGEEVQPGVPEGIFPIDAGLPQNRLGLAKWLFDEDHPLTARVMVNRIWQMHFGRGLVKTAEDFGNQGDLPTHPELLDWLAHYFIASDWDLKASID